MYKRYIIECISVLLVTLFIYAAVSKLIDIERFKIQLGKSPLLTSFAPLISWTVPLAEIGIAVLLMIKSVRLMGLYLSLFLMILFTAYIIIILNFSYYIPCSCGGVLQGLSWKAHVKFNCTCLVLIIIGIILIESRKPQKLNPLI